MKRVGLISTAVLSLTLGIAAPAYAWQEQHDQQEEQKAKPAHEQEKKAQPSRPAKQEEKAAQPQERNTRQEETSAPQQGNNSKQEQKNAQQQDNNAKQEQKSAQQQEQNTKQEQKNAQQQQRQPAQQAKPEQQPQRAAGNRSGRIPDDRYRANFGREHRFHVTQSDYSRDRRFQYGGYWFGFVDPWPSNWLYTQDVFVVEIDGVYYLCNPMYPGVNITLSVAM